MRSSVSVILSSPAPDTSMSHPDYEQTAHDHAAILVLVKHIGGQLKSKSFTRIFERISRQNHVKVTDSAGVCREVLARYIKEYPVENNDWGDYQTHRRLLGLITVGKFDTQQELNELCRIHESLKVKYTSTLFDSRSVLLGLPIPSEISPDTTAAYTTPSNFKARALFYPDVDNCPEMETQILEFLSSLFWVLESKRLERSREKVDKVSLLLAPFERKDFVGLDLESRTNRKRCVGRMTKHLGDLCLQAGLANEALGYYISASEILKTVNDWLWLGGSFEGMCAASVVILYPNLSRILPLQRNSSLQEGSPGKQRSNSITTSSLPNGTAEAVQETTNVLSPEDIPKRYREAIIHYTKYQNAGIVEMEACFKAAHIAVEQGCSLQASTFLQNVLLINLTLSESEKLQRFVSLADVYTEIGFHRKAAFCKRLAAMRYVSPQNQQPNWAQCYQLMLQALSGHKLSLDPTEFPKDGLQGWPVLQIQLLQELVVAAKRMGHSALATRHMTFLLQTLWPHLSALEQRDMSVQLQALAAQCEGAPVPLVLESGDVIPPANLVNLPEVRSFTLKNLMPHLRPQKIVKIKEDMGPFLFTPIHFGSLERRSHVITHKLDYFWVEGDMCEVAMELNNPLPFELTVANMRLLTTGTVFESVPSSLSLPANSGPHPLTLTGTPKEIGELEVQGYSTHTLGVKSNCRLKHMNRFPHPHFLIDVIPALPRMQVSTSLPKSASFSSLGDPAHVVTSASLSLYAGESAEFSITLTNTSDQPIEMLEVSVNSTLDHLVQDQVFQWSQENLQAQLPLSPGAEATFTVYVYAVADFLNTHISDNDTSSLVFGSQPGSIFSDPSSLPSRLSSTSGRDSYRRNEVSPSFRASSSCSGSSQSSTRFPLTRLAMPHDCKFLEGQLKLRYSGGPGLVEGFCRQCSVAVIVEMVPSVCVTHWDVLPAETSNQFYLVLDIANMTTHELELQYTPSKCILIEGEESCRIPVPVDRFSLAKLSRLYDGSPVSADDRQELDAMCSEHIASSVDLRWKTVTGETNGKVSLSGIMLSMEMLDLVRMSPLQWEVTLNSHPVRVQEELGCQAGQCLRLGITVRNFLQRGLKGVLLDVRFYQDHQNGVSNYRLETRLASAGASKVQLPELAEQGSAYHECNVVFFTPGLYKVDIQCSSLNSVGDVPSSQSSGDTSHTWRFIPPLAISVVD